MKEVVDNVCGAHLVMKDVEDSIIPVNGGEGPSHPSPFIITIDWNRWISVVKKRVNESPKVKQNNGKAIPKGNRQKSVIKSQLCKASNACSKCQCGEN